MSTYISEEDLQRLTAGSYEQQINRVARVIEEARVFGPDVKTRVIGTFGDQAVVLSEDGKVARVWLSGTDHLAVSKVRHEVSVVVSEQRMSEYVRAEVRAALGEWRAGRAEESRRRLERISPHVSSVDFHSEDSRARRHLCWIGESRSWEVVTGNREGMLRFLGSDNLRILSEERLAPKFRALETMQEAEQIEYRDLVRHDLAYLISRVESLQAEVEASYEDVRDVVQVEGSGTVGIQSFCRDLAQDVGILYRVLVDTSEFRSVSEQGRLYDAAVAKLPAFEVAGHVAKEAARRLGKSGVSQ